MDIEIILGFVAIFALIAAGGFIHWLISAKNPTERCEIPNIGHVPRHPVISRMRDSYKIDSGRTLLELSTRIYLEKVKIYTIPPKEKSSQSVAEARRLISDVKQACSEIDKEAQTKTEKEFEKFKNGVAKL